MRYPVYMGVRAGFVLLVVLAACVPGRPVPEPSDDEPLRAASPTSYVMRRANRGPENYSAWFADSDGERVYFGLSPFWTLWWERSGDSAADLEAEGDLVIGTFDLAEERFLTPFSLRESGVGSTSVWDVLAHSSGLVCFTTYFDAMGCYDPETRQLTRFGSAGVGLNELWEGPGGDLYVTRYSSAPQGDPYQGHGAVAVVGTDGRLLREYRLANPPGGVTAPKSVAVDPRNGEIWVNTDTFFREGLTLHETIHLDSNGVRISRTREPELHFMSFSDAGVGFFAEVDEGALYLRITDDGDVLEKLRLGPIHGLDFVQDIKHDSSGRVVLTLWSGAVYVATPSDDGWSARGIALPKPASCRPPEGRSIFYSAFAHGDRVCATLFCGGRVLCASLTELQDDPGRDG